MTKFLIFRNMRIANQIVDRVYPLSSVKYIEYNHVQKWFNVFHIDGSWHQLKSDDDENGKMFNQFIDKIRDDDKTIFK